MKKNLDKQVVESFGDEWKKFNHHHFDSSSLKDSFNQYFDIFPLDSLNVESEGFDMGCGSGRWSKFIAPHVGKLNLIDPSQDALSSAMQHLSDHTNCNYICSGVSETNIQEGSQDFGYCLGVLHHIPDTQKGINDCSKLLKKGAPFLLYLYYRFDNKPLWFKGIWYLSNIFRLLISSMPKTIKNFICEVIAIIVYLPLAKISKTFETAGINVDNFPLSDYRSKPFYILRNDARDRFGTKLEKRFTKNEIKEMLDRAGLELVRFSEQTPYWVCLSSKR